MLKKYMDHLYKDAECINELNIQNQLIKFRTKFTDTKLLDVGCWDGIKTIKWGESAGASKVYGLEQDPSAAAHASCLGIKTAVGSADGKWPFEDEKFNFVVSNQVVEHLSNIDNFFSNAYRVLTKAGILVISTNNLASLHNILALSLGWAPFDLSNSSTKILSIGNPLSQHRGEKSNVHPGWVHKCIYTISWLKEWGELYGFKFISRIGSGLHPFPAVLGRYIPQYSAFIVLTFIKEDR